VISLRSRSHETAFAADRDPVLGGAERARAPRDPVACGNAPELACVDGGPPFD
jgi:hypothetical protein